MSTINYQQIASLLTHVEYDQSVDTKMIFFCKLNLLFQICQFYIWYLHRSRVCGTQCTIMRQPLIMIQRTTLIEYSAFLLPIIYIYLLWPARNRCK